MKKAIRALFCVLAASLLTVSCTKTSLNKFAITGEWEMVHVLTYDINNLAAPINTWTPGADGISIIYEFLVDGEVVCSQNKVNSALSSTQTGTWYIDGSTLYLNFTTGKEVYKIETANLTDLILFRDVLFMGKQCVESTTFRRYY